MKTKDWTQGKLLVIDGGEGSGKSTIIKFIQEVSPDASFGGGKKIVITREPGGSEFAEEIRNLMLNHPLAKQADANTQFGLVWASRADHLKNLILPAVANGDHVISDRFDSSTYAYQLCGQRADHLKDLFWKVREVYLKDIQPALYIYFDVEVTEGLRRASLRKGKGEINHFDNQTVDFHERVREGYREFLSRVQHVVIDANRPIEKVKEDFFKAVKAAL